MTSRHTNETKNQSIELRAQGLSFDAIAKKLNAAKTTLLRWQRDHDSEIRSLRAIELDAMYDRIFASHEVEAKRLAAVQAKIEATIAERPFTIGTGFEFIKASALLRKEIRELRERTTEAIRAAVPSTQPEPATSQLILNQPQTTNPTPTSAPVTN